MTANTSQSTACPCVSGRPYSACCGHYHAQHEHDGRCTAPDAPTLMRSRYSAFVLGRWAYLLATWHPSTRPSELEPEPSGLKWLGLEVKRSQALSNSEALVEFVARSKLGGRAHRLHERSRFVLEAGQWFYVDGEML
jgi:SEC-C motif-containing protein